MNLDGFNNKRTELTARIALVQPDIIGITEINQKNASWNLTVQDLQLSRYSLYVNFEGRGMALYVSEMLKSNDHQINGASSDATVWCDVTLNQVDTLIIGVVYRSPNASEETNKRMVETITDVVNDKPSHLLIMGDFNFPGINWQTQTSEGSAQEQFYLSSFREWYLWQHMDNSTHFRAQQAANILDLVMTNEEGMVQNLNYCEPIGKSDHVSLQWDLKCYVERQSTKVTKYLYDKANFDDIRSAFRQVDWDELLSGGTVDDQWSLISSVIRNAVNSHVPH